MGNVERFLSAFRKAICDRSSVRLVVLTTVGATSVPIRLLSIKSGRNLLYAAESDDLKPRDYAFQGITSLIGVATMGLSIQELVRRARTDDDSIRGARLKSSSDLLTDIASDVVRMAMTLTEIRRRETLFRHRPYSTVGIYFRVLGAATVLVEIGESSLELYRRREQWLPELTVAYDDLVATAKMEWRTRRRLRGFRRRDLAH